DRFSDRIERNRATRRSTDCHLYIRRRCLFRYLFFAVERRAIVQGQRRPMIVLNNVYKYYGRNAVLKNCSLSVEQGEIVVICGPSGSGKSTLIKCINGLVPFEKGEITVDGVSVGARSTNLPKLRARIGMVFQQFELYPNMTALQN